MAVVLDVTGEAFGVSMARMEPEIRLFGSITSRRRRSLRLRLIEP